ncbi:MAG: 4Fe-4S dicluster domain-containing protein [Candidatus Margulisbacteria bacterium]|nr:4Fe-4S dicluster domain-containing protein [Candidatus Margulisiibacteriota bacterium]
MQAYFISKAELTALISSLLKDSTVVAPVSFQGKNILQPINEGNAGDVNLSGYRTIEPFKSFLFKITEKVAGYFTADQPAPGKKLVFLGVRGCDLEALEVYDKVLGEGEFADPSYLANRQDILLIGADCTDCGPTCFCAMVGGRPFPYQLFDLNLSPVAGGYVAEARTEKGERLIALFNKASDEQLNEKDKIRQQVSAKLEANNQEYKCRCTINWEEAHKINLENTKAWQTITKDCVECSACNFICPTCTCFLLLDEGDEGQGARDKGQGSEGAFVRHKVWDACLKNGYARVAGGANSRPKLYERLQNRYHCKFDYSFDRLGRYTCVGCGRCIDGCAGNIDMRKVYAELVRQVPLTAKLE